MAVVGILTFEDVEELDFVGPLEVFGIASRMGADCRVMLASVDGQPVRCRNGLRIVPDCSMNELPELSILVVPGGLGARTHARTNPGIRELVQRQKGVVASVCSGAVILAEAGVLDGRAATTHHSSIGVLRRFATISVREQA
ncbi:MAG: DJ-1/PfpI family protein, partial [Acidobacteriota bacterium]|nr:DJ-1/PfpI family protein [Acidobacteriota bacterium]